MQIEHGGALDKAMSRFGGKADDWIDLSTGINPEVFPLPEIPPSVWNRLPDEALLASALDTARHYYRGGATAQLVAAPGTQALIQLLPEIVAKGEVAILGPTYQEHQLAFLNGGWMISDCRNVEDIPQSATVAVVVNPNNPDGRVINADVLTDLAHKMARRGGFLVVDEAFADPHPETSIAAHAGAGGLIVLRSFGKFFGLGGLRLGFALTNADLAQVLRRRLGPWAASGPALAIARHAFSDATLLADYTDRLRARRRLLADVLGDVGLVEFGGTMLFSLVESRQAQRLHEALCEEHVLTRKFAYAPQWLRFGLPLDDNEAYKLRRRLTSALERTER